jgi:Domain of unknown function (DUF6362)
MSSSFWTPDLVDKRLAEASQVLRCLRDSPAADAIQRTREALLWLDWLQLDDARFVWMRAEGRPWKAICCRFGVARATATRRREYLLSVIAWRLNGRPIPTTWSRRYLVGRMKFLSSGL